MLAQENEDPGKRRQENGVKKTQRMLFCRSPRRYSDHFTCAETLVLRSLQGSSDCYGDCCCQLISCCSSWGASCHTQHSWQKGPYAQASAPSFAAHTTLNWLRFRLVLALMWCDVWLSCAAAVGELVYADCWQVQPAKGDWQRGRWMAGCQ